ncbi:ABC transporter permease [Mangrovibrevibacter kandeliae]|uniref:ABC transporter permease n=1 Tax=Mangrovibrevibacter kandeliae TaxID=2968473 RepID=UPI002118F865|nr:ABC transporter permease [Aurantimonas sp. CSK15Z-1]MCQ8782005.1 ABC transporter permease [Aurantimonas sp. CSK15Z-1]
MSDALPEEIAAPHLPSASTTRSEFLKPHRIVLALIGVGLIVAAAMTLRWDWLPKYGDLILAGLWMTVLLLVVTSILGFLIAVPVGLAQVTGPRIFAWPAATFCTIIRGTPLLLQIWLLYYGLGSLFPFIPEIRQSFLWPYLRQAWPYGVLALTLSYAGYEGEVMRGAFAGVPKGEIEAARAFGMGRFTLLRRIWLPRAFQRVLPTLVGETVLQLKSTPLVATITISELYAVFARVRQDTYIVYEPLLLLALMYLVLTAILVYLFRLLENRLTPKSR